MLEWGILSLRKKLAWAVAASLSIQLLAVWMTCSSAVAMEKMWVESFPALGVEAHIVKSDPLWGPVKMVFLKNCTLVAELNAKVEHYAHRRNLDAGMGGCFAAKRPHVWWGADDDAADSDEGGAMTPTSPVADGSAATAERNPNIETSRDGNQSWAGCITQRIETLSKGVRRIWTAKGEGPTERVHVPCGKAELIVGHIDFWDRYLAMISTGSTIAELISSDLDLAGSRHEGYRSMQWFFFGCILLKYWPKVVEVQREFLGIAHASRSLFDRKLENLLLHGISSIFCISVQIALGTCFLLIWRQDHALAIFIPKMAFRSFFWLLLLTSILNEFDKRMKWSQRHCTGARNVFFWVLCMVPMILLILPIMATTAWNVRFLLEAHRCGWIAEDADLVSEEYCAAARRSQLACYIFMVQAVLEQFVFFQLDMENLQRPGGLPLAPGVKCEYDLLVNVQ